ncbi:hypothetical protein [Pararhizobium arenae]|uniref:hypothetical protein n=1 Tax=Pararhizobium arenae TaxID=1856850 RepID=UPI00094AB3C2|nr:hypothetical protein [Pararhizobium arenae]
MGAMQIPLFSLVKILAISAEKLSMKHYLNAPEAREAHISPVYFDLIQQLPAVLANFCLEVCSPLLSGANVI